jgi:PKD repeat protein
VTAVAHAHHHRRLRSFAGPLVAALVLATLTLGVLPAQAAGESLTQRVDPAYQASSDINAVLTVGTTTYLGGEFTSMRPSGAAAGTGEVPRSHLAAVDNRTGALLPWNPGANSSVYALAASADGSTVYVGGLFSTLDGATHKRIGAVSATTGSAMPSFSPSTDGKVYAIAVSGSTVYLGGTFSTVNGAARTRLATVSNSGTLLPWTAQPNDSVRSITLSPDGGSVYVGGEFSSVNGLTREKYLTRLSPATAAFQPWTTHPGYPLWSVVATSTAVYVGGNGAGGHASSFTTGGTQLWKFQTDGGVQAVFLLNGVLYVGGHFDNVCTGDTDGPTNGFHCPAGSVGATRHKLVAVVPDTTSTLGFRVDPWDPGANSPLGVFAFSSDGSGLQVGGEFTSIGNFTRQQAYAEFSANTAPVAAFTSTCSALACSFDARSSTDAEGTLAGYTWDFGDGTTATGPTATHTYTTNSTRQVTMTVTDGDGARSVTTQPVSVASAPPTARFTIACPDLTCTVDGSASSDPDGSLAGYAWTYGDGSTDTGVTTGHAYAGAGSYDVTLTVTDSSGGIATTTQSITVASMLSPISFVGSSAVNKSATTFAVPMPAGVQTGDELLLTLTNNNATSAAAPAGWQQVGSRPLAADGLTGTSTVWQRLAVDSDTGGSSVTVTLSGNARAAATLVAYRGTSATTPVTAGWSAAETVDRAAHTTPSASGVPAGCFVVSAWADRSNATTTWTPPAGETVRSSSFGATGTSAHIDTLVTDSGAQVPTGTRVGRTAVADAPSGKAAMWTIVLAPSGS